MSDSPPKPPVLAKKWSETAQPLRRIAAAKRVASVLAEKGRRALRKAFEAGEVEQWTLRLAGCPGGSVTLPCTASLGDLYTIVSAKLHPGFSFKLVGLAR